MYYTFINRSFAHGFGMVCPWFSAWFVHGLAWFAHGLAWSHHGFGLVCPWFQHGLTVVQQAWAINYYWDSDEGTMGYQ